MNDESTPTERYLIQGSIGAGGTGDVFRAWDQHLQRTVAIKRLRADADTGANIRREAGILASLHHPNIVTVFDFVTDEAGQSAVMEYVEGSTLDDVISPEPMPLAAFVELANQVCRGLSAAHERGLVHRDLKAGNLMLQFHGDRSFTCKILDFGLAHVSDEAGAEDSEEIFGSPYTISPEQLERGPVGPYTDIYSLGCVFYRTLSGREPFEAPEVRDVIERHLGGEPPTSLHLIAPGVPGPISHVIMRMLARRPADRPQSAEEVRRAVQSAVRAPSTANRNPTAGSLQSVRPIFAAPAATRKPGGGSTKVWWSLLPLALAAGGFFYFQSLHRSAPAPDPAVPPSAPVYPAVNPLDAKDIAQHNGQTVTMEGVIAAVEESTLFSARLLRFSNASDAAALSVADNLVSMETARAFVGKRVHATGRVSTAARRNRLIIDSPADLRVE